MQPTIASKHFRRSGEDQLVPHWSGIGTAGNSWFYKVPLHPLGEPGHGAVTVERIGSKRTVESRQDVNEITHKKLLYILLLLHPTTP